MIRVTPLRSFGASTGDNRQLSDLEARADIGRQLGELARGALLMEACSFDLIVHFQPLEEPLLHLRRAERQAVADVVEQHQSPLREQPPQEQCLDRNVGDLTSILRREHIENISVQDEK